MLRITRQPHFRLSPDPEQYCERLNRTILLTTHKNNATKSPARADCGSCRLSRTIVNSSDYGLGAYKKRMASQCSACPFSSFMRYRTPQQHSQTAQSSPLASKENSKSKNSNKPQISETSSARSSKITLQQACSTYYYSQYRQVRPPPYPSIHPSIRFC